MPAMVNVQGAFVPHVQLFSSRLKSVKGTDNSSMQKKSNESNRKARRLIETKLCSCEIFDIHLVRGNVEFHFRIFLLWSMSLGIIF